MVWTLADLCPRQCGFNGSSQHCARSSRLGRSYDQANGPLSGPGNRLWRRTTQRTIMAMLALELGCSVQSAETFDWDSDVIETQAFAISLFG